MARGGAGVAAPVATGGVTGGCMGTAEAYTWRSHANVSSWWQATKREIRFARLLKMRTWIEKN